MVTADMSAKRVVFQNFGVTKHDGKEKKKKNLDWLLFFFFNFAMNTTHTLPSPLFGRGGALHNQTIGS